MNNPVERNQCLFFQIDIKFLLSLSKCCIHEFWLMFENTSKLSTRRVPKLVLLLVYLLELELEEASLILPIPGLQQEVDSIITGCE